MSTSPEPAAEPPGGITVSLVAQISPVRQFNGAPFEGDLAVYAEQLVHYFAENISRYADPRGADVFLTVVAQRGEEMQSQEFRSGHYVKAPLATSTIECPRGPADAEAEPAKDRHQNGSGRMSESSQAVAGRKMQTKRRYASELYPHRDEWDDARPLQAEVPYLYAQAIGWDVNGTVWMELLDTGERDKIRTALDRTMLMIAARGKALLADALLQGMAGQEAWAWAEERNDPEGGEWVWQRAVHYGVNPDAIKPYLCGHEPAHHDHYSPSKMGGGWREVHRVEVRESECVECCEPVPTPDTAAAKT